MQHFSVFTDNLLSLANFIAKCAGGLFMLSGSLITQSKHILSLIDLLGIPTGTLQGGFYSTHLSRSLVEPGLGRLTLHPTESSVFSVTSGSVFLQSIKQTEKSLQVVLFA